MVTDNPYESPQKPGVPTASSTATPNSIRTRLGVLAFNTILLGLFPPICCPCGLGPIGFIFQPYMLLLGVPSIFIPLAIPQIRVGNELTFLSLYVTNYVLMSYGLAFLVDRLRQRRLPSTVATRPMKQSGEIGRFGMDDRPSPPA